MKLETNRLVLRCWVESDAESLYEYAKDPAVGPIAGWPPHKNVDESLNVIKNVLNGAECYAICEKGSDKAIGAIELKLNGHTDMTEKDDECELGYWLGKPFWGRGYMPEAVIELLRHGFETLGMTTIWCGYYDGNDKSKRVQEKVGFIYHHTCEEVPVPLMNEIRVGHTSFMTKEHWEEVNSIAVNNHQEEKIMNKNDYIIRLETPADHAEVENLIRESFWNVYRPGCYEHYLIRCLRKDKDFVPELDFVMEQNHRIIGQNVFMRACIHGDDGRQIPIMTMGPICIAPAFMKQGYGKKLLDYSLEKAAELGCGALCFEGNINFYGKSGFSFASEFGIRYHGLPEDADSSFFLCKELIPGYLNGITGEYAPPQGYFVNEEEAEKFDKSFPYKEKLKLPGQIF